MTEKKKQHEGEINVGTAEQPEILVVRLLSAGEKLDCMVEGRAYLKGIDAQANPDMVAIGHMIARLKRAIVDPISWLDKVLARFDDDYLDTIRHAWNTYADWAEAEMANLKNG